MSSVYLICSHEVTACLSRSKKLRNQNLFLANCRRTSLVSSRVITLRTTLRVSCEKLRGNTIDKKQSLTCNSITNSSMSLYCFPIILLQLRFDFNSILSCKFIWNLLFKKWNDQIKACFKREIFFEKQIKTYAIFFY